MGASRPCVTSSRRRGFGHDWDRELANVTDIPVDQWLSSSSAGRAVERQAAELNWCPSETVPPTSSRVLGRTVLALCSTIEAREMDQWFFTITDYAEELLEDLDDLEGWPNNVREMQRNWIGKQEGASVAFEVGDYGEVDIFTTRLDTIHGATFYARLPVIPRADIARQKTRLRSSSRRQSRPTRTSWT